MKFKKIITLFFVGALLTGCADDDLSSESIFDTASPARNEFDQWLKTNFTDQYNIDFIYRYNDKEHNKYYSFHTNPRYFYLLPAPSCLEGS